MDKIVFKNPVKAGIKGGIRDCQVLKEGGKWFMTGTSPGFWPGEENPGVRLYSSENLAEWRDEGLLIDRSKIAKNAWCRDRFWAPELHKWNGRWLLSFNCRNESEEFKHAHGCGLAVADDLRGPYKILTEKEPLVAGNDFHLFIDDDNTPWAFWNCGFIFSSEIDLENARLKGETFKHFTKSPDIAAWDYIGIEGSWVMKRSGTYFLFYSSWSRGYEVGYATAKSPRGPFVKSPNSPVYGEIDPELCRKQGTPRPPPHDPASPFIQAGHNAIFEGPDGELWTSCHGMLKDGEPFLCMDPLLFGADGEPRYCGPSFTERTFKRVK